MATNSGTVTTLPAPPVCRNCKRVVDSTRRLAILIDGVPVFERDLCSACKVHTLDCAEQPAPWIQSVPVR